MSKCRNVEMSVLAVGFLVIGFCLLALGCWLWSNQQTKIMTLQIRLS